MRQLEPTGSKAATCTTSNIDSTRDLHICQANLQALWRPTDTNQHTLYRRTSNCCQSGQNWIVAEGAGFYLRVSERGLRTPRPKYLANANLQIPCCHVYLVIFIITHCNIPSVNRPRDSWFRANLQNEYFCIVVAVPLIFSPHIELFGCNGEGNPFSLTDCSYS